MAELFEPLYNRAKLEKRIESLQKGAMQDIAASHGKIKEHVTAKLEALSRAFTTLVLSPFLADFHHASALEAVSFSVKVSVSKCQDNFKKATSIMAILVQYSVTFMLLPTEFA